MDVMGIVVDEAGTAFIVLDEGIPDIATATGLRCDGRQVHSNSVSPFDVVAAVCEMEPINFSLPSIQHAKLARRVKNNCSVCSHRSFEQKQQQRANTSGRRLTDDEQTQTDEGGALGTSFREPPWLHEFAT